MKLTSRRSAVIACVFAISLVNCFAAGHSKVIELWPGVAPGEKGSIGEEHDITKPTDSMVAGKRVVRLGNVTKPTISLYRAPAELDTGTAVLVIPGGGYSILAMDLEGTEICAWLNSIGVSAVLLKYRVPSIPYVLQCDCRPHNLSLSVPSLQDAQRTMRLVRFHAAQWHVDPHKIGVLGFSAGGFLVAEISTNFDRQLYAPVDGADKVSARPDFAMAIYPGHLATDDDKFNPNLPITRDVPPTFLVQAEDDYTDGVHQSLVYYAALAKAHVPAEMHLYAHGGHAFGLRSTKMPITDWPALADTWLRTIGMIQD